MGLMTTRIAAALALIVLAHAPLHADDNKSSDAAPTAKPCALLANDAQWHVFGTTAERERAQRILALAQRAWTHTHTILGIRPTKTVIKPIPVRIVDGIEASVSVLHAAPPAASGASQDGDAKVLVARKALSDIGIPHDEQLRIVRACARAACARLTHLEDLKRYTPHVLEGIARVAEELWDLEAKPGAKREDRLWLCAHMIRCQHGLAMNQLKPDGLSTVHAVPGQAVESAPWASLSWAWVHHLRSTRPADWRSLIMRTRTSMHLPHADAMPRASPAFRTEIAALQPTWRPSAEDDLEFLLREATLVSAEEDSMSGSWNDEPFYEIRAQMAVLSEPRWGPSLAQIEFGSDGSRGFSVEIYASGYIDLTEDGGSGSLTPGRHLGPAVHARVNTSFPTNKAIDLWVRIRGRSIAMGMGDRILLRHRSLNDILGTWRISGASGVLWRDVRAQRL